jgi:(p)ppGpp synthase/HD superfamily hydrolase
MILSERFDAALVLASDLHRDQTRKQTEIPYVAHLLAVTAIVLEHCGDEDQATAALLHDAPEDQGGRTTLDIIRDRFGDRVAGIVEDCTDTFEDPKPEWLPRKIAYLDHLEHQADAPALLVSAADKLHNLRAIRGDFAHQGDQLWCRFNGRPGQQLWYFQSLARIYAERLPGRLADTFSHEVERFAAELAAAGIQLEVPTRD